MQEKPKFQQQSFLLCTVKGYGQVEYISNQKYNTTSQIQLFMTRNFEFWPEINLCFKGPKNGGCLFPVSGFPWKLGASQKTQSLKFGFLLHF